MNSKHFPEPTSPLTTSQSAFLAKVLHSETIPLHARAYFHEQASNELHELVLDEFREQEHEHAISRAALARRIDKAPEQITRWLGAPGNWTIHTAVDLLLGMGFKLNFSIERLDEPGDENDLRQFQIDHLVKSRPFPQPALGDSDGDLSAALALLKQHPGHAQQVPQAAPELVLGIPPGKIKSQPSRAKVLEWRPRAMNE